MRGSAPEEFKKRMLAKKKNGTVPQSEKPRFQFQNERTCHFGEKCEFSHNEVAGGGNKGQKRKKLSPNKEKMRKLWSHPE